MAEKYDLHHWDNVQVKNWIIVALCALKNDIYLIYDNRIPVATFQTRKVNDAFLFQKLATLPELSGQGIGTFCMNEIERLGRNAKCQEIICEVYDQSEQAKAFYEHRGYRVYGSTDTWKYRELTLHKELWGKK